MFSKEKVLILDTDIKFLPGVGPKKAELLNKELSIFRYRDLLYHFPYKYVDRSKFYTIAEIDSTETYIQLRGKINRFELAGEKHKSRFVAHFSDGTGSIELLWFKGIKWVKERLKPGVEYIVFGKPSIFNRKMNLVHPEIEEAASIDKSLNANLEAHYPTTEKMKNNFLPSKAIFRLMQVLVPLVQDEIVENLPAYLRNKFKLMSLKDALVAVHFPDNSQQLEKARFRLKYEELFFIQLNIIFQKKLRQVQTHGFVFEKVGEYLNQFYKNNLPFELTGAQKRVIREIRADIGSGKQMNRLLQGDVGSGKTLVALMCMLIALDNGYQACLMAPTEILAKQHFDSIYNFLDDMDIQIALLTGSTKKKQRDFIHAALLDGSLQILIGTHALLEDVVQFKNLGFVVIDEQHRFGVAQRARLWKKNENPPHVLVMTATPIPRTLAMTVYGDLEVSVIDELPPGRKPIKTSHYYDSKRLEVFGFMRRQIAAGRQVYIVYPLIKESEKMDYKDLEDGYESIVQAFPPPNYQVSIVHGKMKQDAKDLEMKRFVEGQTQIMVATTVIEVGVDVPNASIMVIESAERFGLSQLHQLRGRVGRGAEQSYCILMTSYKLSIEGRRRIELMTQTTDGFEISEADLKMRGPGDIEGTQQSGIPFDLKIASLGQDGQILQLARDAADAILNHDPDLAKPINTLLNSRIKEMNRKEVDWGQIS
ncbi:MAG: ATP-dependent DNA helicase RecG [Bacteroidales bacterium]|nr:ATP-dependent DNA helicase RecG [Bacteroidales bacterium]MCF8456001.1 ATP-dependent DNA helicase RecG [Bacteroidales bacterium]